MATLAAAAGGHLGGREVGESAALTFDERAAVGVVLAAPGYPEAPRAGDRIDGLEEANDQPGVHVLAAGVSRAGGDLVTAGGRVVCVTGMGVGVADARQRAYAAVASVSWPEAVYRRDIAAAVE